MPWGLKANFFEHYLILFVFIPELRYKFHLRNLPESWIIPRMKRNWNEVQDNLKSIFHLSFFYKTLQSCCCPMLSSTQHHGTDTGAEIAEFSALTEWFGLEEPFEAHLIPTPCQRREKKITDMSSPCRISSSFIETRLKPSSAGSFQAGIHSGETTPI